MRLPQSFASNDSTPAQDFLFDIMNPTVTSLSTSDPSINFVLENTIDVVFTEMNATQSRQFIIDDRSSIISPSARVTTPKINRSFSFTSPLFSYTQDR